MNLEIVASPLRFVRLTDTLVPLSLSSAWLEFLGSEIGEGSLDTLLPFVDDDRKSTFNAQLANLIEAGEGVDGDEVRIAVGDRVQCVRIWAWREEQGLPWQIELFLDDSQKADRNLERIRSEFEMILASAGEGIYGLDENGACTFANAASTKILGWDANEVLGESVHDIHHHTRKDGSHYPVEECFVYKALTDGETHRVTDEVFWTNEGKPVPVEYVSTPIIKNGNIEGAVIIFRDISDRLEQENIRETQLIEIKKLKDELELERDYLRQEIKFEHSFKNIIGSSNALTLALKKLEAVANAPTSVLITGESGVGKEVFARAIHERSDRCDAPLVKVNCASIPKELFESEFFGHIRGAFTGAQRDRIGRLQLANNGTIFLDEVGEIPLELQGKLLRALQEQEFEAVGDEKTIKVDVRVIAATNRDLKKEVELGNFREDLFYRLSVFPIHIPPLRERLSDVPILVQHLLRNLCQDLGRPLLKIRKAHVELLSRHRWPGNIRELKNAIERAIILSESEYLRVDLAMPELVSPAIESAEPQQTATDEMAFLTEEQMQIYEKNNLKKALKACNWKIAGKEGAAKKMGIKPSTLTYRMEKLGIVKD